MMDMTMSTMKLRLVSSEQSLLTRCDGSAQFNQGNTSVLTAIFGPTELRISKTIVDKATVEVVYRPKVGLTGCVDKMQERMICNTCETVIFTVLHPRSGINVIVQELQDSGSLLSCCINSACLALLDASIPMKFMVAAITCAVDMEEHIILDPTSQQEASAKAVMTFAFDSKEYNVVTSTAIGTYTDELYQRCLAICKEASKEIIRFYKDAVKKKVEKTLNCESLQCQ